jgi:acyl transferase domain-containing protein/thioesterase domain-containing protein
VAEKDPQQRQKMTPPKGNEAPEGIAVIGMAGRFPGANNVGAFWESLSGGQESITFFAEDELDSSISPELRGDPHYVKARGILEDADKFDAAFFGIAPREAQIMDPQHRVLMEVAWEAFEDAGYDPGSYDGLVGVFAGTGFNHYFTNNILTRRDLMEAVGHHIAEIGNAPDYLSTRISYKFNLKGPSLSIYTGCSTSLVAVCLGFDSLMSYQCDMALAGGVFVACPLNSGYLYQEGEMYSPDGHTRPFDARAQGTVFSSGAGAVVLKRVSDALRDKDHIYAILLGAGLNNDGSDKMSFTAPSVDGQAEAIVMAHANAGVHPETISFVETHGTATPLGDPIEVAALTQAFRSQTAKKNYCAIGSVKSNIGHLDAAAGVAGLIKTALALYHKQIPASLNFDTPNPKIDFTSSPFYVNTHLLDWKTDDVPRRAGLSSFGVGGTNSHVILEEAPMRETSGTSRPWQLLLLSARTGPALDRATANLRRYLEDHPDLNLADVAYTLQIGRRDFNHRRMVVCKDLRDVLLALETVDPRRVVSGIHEPMERDIVFMFSGQGAQYVNMGLEVYRNESIFRTHVDHCSELLKPHLGVDLRDVLYPVQGDEEQTAERLRQTFITQPALFVFEYALARLWMEWGLRPTGFAGHSIGEYVAACLSGVFTLEDALSLIAFRGRLIQERPKGTMMAVFLSEEEIQPFLGNRISLAVINGPRLCVVSGEDEAIEDLEAQLSTQKIDCRNLHTSHAFHSQMMDPILEAFFKEVEKVKRNPPRIPFVSNVTGKWITPEKAVSPDYWRQHLRQTVRFSDCIAELLKEPNRVLLEVGPGQTLRTLAKHHPDRVEEQIVLSSTRHPKEQRSDLAFLLETVGRLWLSGIDLDWCALYAGEDRNRIPLPTYPFERKRHWVDPGEQVCDTASPATGFLESLEIAPSSDQVHEGHGIDSSCANAPRDEVEETVAKIWQASLGINPVGIYDNFFDLGGSSLVAVGIFTEIEKTFGKKLPLAILYEAPTVEQLANLLRQEEWKPEWDSLVAIRGGGTRPPLFLVHGAGGNVLLYRELARYLDEDQPVYGLQSQGLDGDKPFLTRVEDMASCYLEEVLAFRSDGPYFLGGYCLGGSVALEMAQQLRAMGKEVGLLIFMETYNFSNIPDQSFLDNVYYYIQKIDFHLRNFLLLNANDKWTFIKEKTRVAKDRRKVWYGMIASKIGEIFRLGNAQSSTLSDLWKINDLAALNYEPKAYAGRIAQFVPKREYAHHIGPGLAWDGLATGELENHQLPVYPAGMLVEPFVRFLAKKIEVCIGNVQNTV